MGGREGTGAHARKRCAVTPMSWNVLYVFDFIAVLVFAISYERKCYQRGYRIDFWHAQLFLICVLPNMFLLPFARNQLNGLVLGRDFAAVVDVMPYVFLLTLLGFFSVLVGGSFWRLRAGTGLRSAATRVLDIVPQCSMMLMSSRTILVFQALICIVMQVAILAFYFAHSGFGFDLREYTFANPALRPVALIISGYSIVIASHCLARYIDFREKILLACTLGLTFGLVFFGARSNILEIYLNILLCYLIRMRGRISIFRIAGVVVIITLVGLYLGNVRAGQYSLSTFFSFLIVALFFGNNFSDLRDFAWVYALWNHKYWHGKTYLAAVTSFVPRFASAFRDRWGLGVATATTLGFDPHVHPGVRPGVFGEGFFNFGIPGVIVIGLLIGIILRRVDMDTKRALLPPRPSMRKAFASTMLLNVIGTITISSSFSSLYVLGGIYLFSWGLLLVLRLIRIPHHALADA